MSVKEKSKLQKSRFNRKENIAILNFNKQIKFKKKNKQYYKNSLITAFNKRIFSGSIVTNKIIIKKYDEDKNKLNTEKAFRNIMENTGNLSKFRKYNNHEIYESIISTYTKYKELQHEIEKLNEELIFLENFPCKFLASKLCENMSFEYIRYNVYVSREREKFLTNEEISLCGCHKKNIPICDTYCLNNQLQTDCDSLNCITKECHNKLLKLDIPKLDLIKTQTKGYGVITKETILKGRSIIEYNGEVIDLTEHIKRENIIYKGATDFYAIYINKKTIIDGTNKGNISRFFNHSCSPNMVAHKRIFKNELHLLFYAKCIINVGDELTFDYNASVYGNKQIQCFCGSNNCRKFI